MHALRSPTLLHVQYRMVLSAEHSYLCSSFLSKPPLMVCCQMCPSSAGLCSGQGVQVCAAAYQHLVHCQHVQVFGCVGQFEGLPFNNVS